MLVLPVNTSEMVARNDEPLAGTPGEARERVELFGAAEDAFMDSALAHFPSTPPNHTRLIESGGAGMFPDRVATVLKAGAIRCAAT
jgi:hypothetical protein